MIKVNELRKHEDKSVRYQNGDGITLEAIKRRITLIAERHAIPVAFLNDQVKFGGLFNSSVEDCLVVYHPDHRNDYIKFCILVTRQGRYAFVEVNEFGHSKQLYKAAYATLGRSERKLQEEQMYYACILDVFDETFR